LIRVYIWDPAGLVTALEVGIAPDFGHAAMEVISEGDKTTYVSYWPEMDTPVGQVMQLIKTRSKRHPDSFSEEIDTAAGFMEREPSFIGELQGIYEDKIRILWEDIKVSEYDFFTWNCSNVCKFLILSAMDENYHDEMLGAAVCTPEDLLTVASADDLVVRLRILATSSFIDCRPDDLHRMVEAYKAAFADSPNEKPDSSTTDKSIMIPAESTAECTR